jgi:hypothetical protein
MYGASSNEMESGQIRASHQIRLGYWASFSEMLQAKASDFKIRRANKDHWFAFSTGRSGSVISATISTDKERIGVEIYNHGDETKAVFDGLFVDKDSIEKELNEKLDWQRLDEKKATRIALFKTGENPSDQESWPSQQEWMLSQMVKFKKVFGPRLARLK